MNIKKIINCVFIMKQLIQESPELFHDGIDIDLINLLNDIEKEVRKK